MGHSSHATSSRKMSPKPHSLSVPEQTVLVAQASFPKGNPYLILRDAFGSIFTDEDFADLYPRRGQPGYSPWRLALVTIMQFRKTSLWQRQDGLILLAWPT